MAKDTYPRDDIHDLRGADFTLDVDKGEHYRGAAWIDLTLGNAAFHMDLGDAAELCAKLIAKLAPWGEHTRYLHYEVTQALAKDPTHSAHVGAFNDQ
jgi:hypothetical protein